MPSQVCRQQEHAESSRASLSWRAGCCRFFSYGLEKKPFRPEVYRDFEQLTLKVGHDLSMCATVGVGWHAHSFESDWCLQDLESGHLYALEKFWGFHHYTGLPAGCSVTINSKVGTESADRRPSA